MIPMQEVPCKGPSPPKIGYVLKRFPRISETFILNEVLELERQGDPIEILSLSEPTEEVRSKALKRVQAKVNMTSSRRVALLMASTGCGKLGCMATSGGTLYGR